MENILFPDLISFLPQTTAGESGDVLFSGDDFTRTVEGLAALVATEIAAEPAKIARFSVPLPEDADPVPLGDESRQALENVTVSVVSEAAVDVAASVEPENASDSGICSDAAASWRQPAEPESVPANAYVKTVGHGAREQTAASDNDDVEANAHTDEAESDPTSVTDSVPVAMVAVAPPASNLVAVSGVSDARVEEPSLSVQSAAPSAFWSDASSQDLRAVHSLGQIYRQDIFAGSESVSVKSPQPASTDTVQVDRYEPSDGLAVADTAGAEAVTPAISKAISVSTQTGSPTTGRGFAQNEPIGAPLRADEPTQDMPDLSAAAGPIAKQADAYEIADMPDEPMEVAAETSAPTALGKGKVSEYAESEKIAASPLPALPSVFVETVMLEDVVSGTDVTMFSEQDRPPEAAPGEDGPPKDSAAKRSSNRADLSAAVSDLTPSPAEIPAQPDVSSDMADGKYPAADPGAEQSPKPTASELSGQDARQRAEKQKPEAPPRLPAFIVEVPAENTGTGTAEIASSVSPSANADKLPETPDASQNDVVAAPIPAIEQPSEASAQSGVERVYARTSQALSHDTTRQIAEAIHLSTDGSFELTLSPGELGRLHLKLDTDDGNMSVTINADRPETLDLVRRNAESLARDLRDLGYTQVSFSFSQQDDASGHSGREKPMETMTCAQEYLSGEEIAVFSNSNLSSGTLDLRI